MAATPVISASAVAAATTTTAPVSAATTTAPVSAATACRLGIDGDCHDAHGGDGRHYQRFDRSHVHAP
jgi:hypothetical protein